MNRSFAPNPDRVQRTKVTGFFVAGLLALQAALPASAENKLGGSFADLTIEQLMDESVSSVSKRATKLSESPAAVSVITQDDIRRLGLTTLPEALRWVPGLDVARSSANQWAVSARGFNNQFSNKLLVLVDGRTIYSPAFGGVIWDLRDMAMENIDRIEVIRGPGATLWGANAVNGVINIITKNARDTQGGFVSGVTGSEEHAGGTVQYGGRLGSNAYYRAYLKAYDREGFIDSPDRRTPDDWDALHGGFRLDWQPTTQDAVTLQGDYYSAHDGDTRLAPDTQPPFALRLDQRYHNTGGNVLGKWTHTISDTSDLSFQTFYDHFHHGQSATYETRDTVDFEFQHRFGLGSRQEIIWGAGYRVTKDVFSINPELRFSPGRREDQLFTAFVQDQIALVPKKLWLTLGSKFEHNDYTGFEVQPGARLLWTPTEHQTAWAAVSRAVRTPTRTETDMRFFGPATIPTPIPVLQDFMGNRSLHSEELVSFELGYRVEPIRQFSLDLALFYNQYNGLISYKPGSPELKDPFTAPHLELPLMAINANDGETYGGELAVQWKVTDRWRLALDYSLLQMHLHPATTLEGESPEQQVRLRSYLQLPWDLEFNAACAYVDELPAPNVPAYLRVDLGLVWRPKPSLEIGVWGQNLLDNRHLEFTNYTTPLRTEIPRSVQVKVTWKF
jgi:iron complex outermembrane receptor protein